MRQTWTIEIEGEKPYDKFEGTENTPYQYNHLKSFFEEIGYKVIQIKEETCK